MTKVMPFGDQLRKPTSTWICNACPMAGIRLITAAALAMTLMAGTATAATKPTPIAQKEAAVQAAQLAARAFVTVVKSKRQVFPIWSGTTLDDRPWSTKRLVGAVTVVNFWASWCGPCKEEWGELQRAAAANPKIVFIGINTMDKFESARTFLDGHPSAYVQVLDERGVMMASYTNIPHGVMPTTMILDKRGKIAAWRAGPLKQAQLQRGINSVLATA